MFTGLIQAIGRVERLEATDAGRRLVLDAGGWPHHPEAGASIAVSGCCLTVAAPVRGGRLVFDVVGETLAATTLGAWSVGARVNLEHAARADTLLGGHLVQGHIDGVGVASRVTDAGDERRVRIEPPADLVPLIPHKGSIAVDGVSLTVAGVSDAGAPGWFEVALIPTTLGATTLGGLREGARVNLETDILARTVAHWLSRGGSA